MWLQVRLTDACTHSPAQSHQKPGRFSQQLGGLSEAVFILHGEAKKRTNLKFVKCLQFKVYRLMSSECTYQGLLLFYFTRFLGKAKLYQGIRSNPSRAKKLTRTTLYAFGFRCNVLSYLKNRGSFLIQIHCFLQIHWFNESVRVQAGQ